MLAKLTHTVVLHKVGIPRFHIVIVRCIAIFGAGVAVAIASIIVVVLCLFGVIATTAALLPVVGLVGFVLPMDVMLFYLTVGAAIFYGAEMCVTVDALVAPIFGIEMVCAKGGTGVELILGFGIVARACGATGAIKPINMCLLAVVGFYLVMRRRFKLFAVIVTECRYCDRCGIGDLLNAESIGEELAAAGNANVILDVACVRAGGCLCCNADNGMSLGCLVNVVTRGAGAGGVFGCRLALAVRCGVDVIIATLNGANVCVCILVDGGKYVGINVISTSRLRAEP